MSGQPMSPCPLWPQGGSGRGCVGSDPGQRRAQAQAHRRASVQETRCGFTSLPLPENLLGPKETTTDTPPPPPQRLQCSEMGLWVFAQHLQARQFISIQNCVESPCTEVRLFTERYLNSIKLEGAEAIIRLYSEAHLAFSISELSH